jgi:adenosylcobinamide-GDP ribazoletransferase
MRGLALAFGFLTVLPVRLPAPRAGELGRAGAWFPWVGLALGVALSAAHGLLNLVLPPLLSAVVVVALWAALTGGLHLDGLADCGDGLASAAAPERRLEIMRDPRLGAFGALTLVLFLIAKVAAVTGLPALAWWGRGISAPVTPALLPAGPFLLAAVTARWLILLAARAPSARPGGMGADFALGLRPSVLLLAALVPAVLAVLGGPRALLGLAAAHLVAFALLRFARARLGGITGDVLGMIVEVSELTILIAYAAGQG